MSGLAQRVLFISASLSCLLLISTPLATAQPGAAQPGGVQPGDRPRQPLVPGLPMLQKVEIDGGGTVKQVARGVMHVVSEEGEQWLVRVDARPQDITYMATADASFVKPRMFVRFTSKLSKRGQATEPVTSLTIFTPREGYDVGVRPTAGEGTDAGDPDEGGGTPSAAELFGGEEGPEKKPKARANANSTPDENTDYLVSGQVTKISRTGEMTIAARKATVKADLSEDAEVSLDMGNLALLRPGDKVEFRGWHLPNQKGQAIATKVTATAAQPLSGNGKKKPLAKAAEIEKPADTDKPAKADKPAEDTDPDKSGDESSDDSSP